MKKRYLLLLILAGIVLILIGLRIYLPYYLTDYVNAQINQLDNHTGKIDDVDVHLWRGAYQVEGLEIWRTDVELEDPLLDAATIDFSIFWRQLLRGHLVAEIDLRQPIIHLIDSPAEQPDQTGADANWVSLTNNLVPFRIDRIEVHDGTVRFHNYHSETPVDLSMTGFNAIASNFTNSLEISETLIASITASGLIEEQSELSLEMRLNPQQSRTDFDFNLEFEPLSLSKLDSLIKTYAPFDAEGGTLALASELVAENGQLDGYIKPVIKNLNVFNWKADVAQDGDNPFQVIWENLVDVFGEIFENQPRDQIATRIPVSGNLNDFETDIFATIINILRNAFIQAINPSVDDSIDFSQQTSEDGGDDGDTDKQIDEQ